ncbi:hypothetical protein RND71_029695 [Anisodus tanguticus]|uniref:FBD domain-containing protein n=1 Tax=Anisodus tanguticus TaxID=243964 RepID=A0AAE1RGC5_9SOLA|nr:hypothetical protein RND71_029695 [Anisodus tanguticus]
MEWIKDVHLLEIIAPFPGLRLTTSLVLPRRPGGNSTGPSTLLPDLETLVIDWTKQTSRDLLSRFINEDENGRMFEKHIFDCSLLHLRTVKIINYYGPLRANKFIMPLVKHLLKNAEVLENMVIAASLHYNKFQGSDVSRDFVEIAQELLCVTLCAERIKNWSVADC